MDEATLKAYDRDPAALPRIGKRSLLRPTSTPRCSGSSSQEGSQQTSGAVVAGMRLGSTAAAIPPGIRRF